MNPKRYSQIERALSILDKSATVDILKDDQYLLFVFKKTERIVSATYILTGLFPDNEPLKWELRESTLRLLKDMLSSKERSSVHTKEFVSGTLSALAEVLSLFDIAHIADLVSPMNFSVMQKELEGLCSIMEGRGRLGALPVSQPFLEEAFFGIPKEIFAGAEKSENTAWQAPDTAIGSITEFERLQRTQRDIYKGHTGNEGVLYRKMPRQRTSASEIANETRENVAAPAASNAAREERKRKILEVLQQKGSAIIKDFTIVIQGCSEKTIQRLLVELVGENILKREGERRWSRYSLVSPSAPAA